MSNSETDHSNLRGSADLWLAAAHEALLEGGVDAVRILPLAQKLNLSRASFYWSFKTRDDLMAALLQNWERQNTLNLIERCKAYADTVSEAVLNVSDCWFDPKVFDSRLELAVRSWAMQSAEVLGRVRDSDEARLAALAQMFARFDMRPERAEVRGRTMYLVQIGYISMQSDEDMSLRLRRLPNYVETFSGCAPTEREMQRFLARNRLTGAYQP